MEKRIGLLVLLLLCGCGHRKSYACSRFVDDNELKLTINYIYDDIESINVRKTYKVPYNVLLDVEKLEFLNSQLDNTYHFEDNLLIQEYNLALDKKYSYNKTVEYLKENKYACK